MVAWAVGRSRTPPDLRDSDPWKLGNFNSEVEEHHLLALESEGMMTLAMVVAVNSLSNFHLSFEIIDDNSLPNERPKSLPANTSFHLAQATNFFSSNMKTSLQYFSWRRRLPFLTLATSRSDKRHIVFPFPIVSHQSETSMVTSINNNCWSQQTSNGSWFSPSLSEIYTIQAY